MTSTGRPGDPRNTVQTSDIDDAQDVLCRYFLPVRLHAAERRPVIDTRLTGVEVGSSTVGSLSFGAQMRIVSEELENYHVNVVITGRSMSRPGTADEIGTGPGHAQVFTPERGTDLHWSPSSTQICVMLDKQATERQLTALLGRDLVEPLTFDPVMDLRTPDARGWGDTLRLIDHEMRRDTGLLDHEITRLTLERLLIETLLTSQPHNYSEAIAGATTESTPKRIRAVIDAVMAHPEAAWTAGELARVAGVSVRALYTSFHDRLGVGPMSYVRGVRLDRVHEELDQGLPGTTVADVARRWGFAHLGRFAASYERRFGQLPSRTLYERGGAAIP